MSADEQRTLKPLFEITAVAGAFLTARCFRWDGTELTSTFDLDPHLGNDNGRFLWGGSEFTKTAWDVRFKNDTILEATLEVRDVSELESSIDLRWRLLNINGSLYARRHLKDVSRRSWKRYDTNLDVMDDILCKLDFASPHVYGPAIGDVSNVTIASVEFESVSFIYLLSSLPNPRPCLSLAL